ncbi:hypothetical protein APSETT444_007441 [Aspergillus pseudonomiae]
MAVNFGDIPGTDLFFRPPLITDEYFPTDLLSYGPTKLSEQLHEIMLELIETSKSMGLDDTEDPPLQLDIPQLAPLFTVSNVAIYISVFFHSLYWHLPVVHFPTFDPGNVSNPLLLSIFLTGATYSSSLDEAALLPRVLDVAEEHVFRKITTLSTQVAPPTHDLTRQTPTIQLLQAALIIEMLQFGQERIETRRRIRIIRHPSLVSLMRCLGIFHLKRSAPPTICTGDDGIWRALVTEEVCIRLASWVFLADGFLTVCFKNRPTISIFEMECPFPWRTELWEAENSSAFSRIAATDAAKLPMPSVREAIRLLLDNSEAGPVASSFPLSAEHLLIMIYGESHDNLISLTIPLKTYGRSVEFPRIPSQNRLLRLRAAEENQIRRHEMEADLELRVPGYKQRPDTAAGVPETRRRALAASHGDA